MAVVWTALAIETGAALVVAASLAGWARRHFTPDTFAHDTFAPDTAVAE